MWTIVILNQQKKENDDFVGIYGMNQKNFSENFRTRILYIHVRKQTKLEEKSIWFIYLGIILK